MPVIPATQEAEAGELLEPGRQRLQSAKIAPLHSSMGKKNKTLSQTKTNKTLKLRGVVPRTQDQPSEKGVLASWWRAGRGETDSASVASTGT